MLKNLVYILNNRVVKEFPSAQAIVDSGGNININNKRKGFFGGRLLHATAEAS